jgi:DNA phosphorothioation-dependent restriction protein DptG
MTQDEIIEMANKASKEWLKEFPTPEETANQVPKRFLEIFAALVAAKEREACAKVCEKTITSQRSAWGANFCIAAIRAKGQA